MKVLADNDASSVDVDHPKVATVEQLVHLPAPAWDGRSPRSAAERQVFVVTADLDGFKLEEDSDWHIVVAGQYGTTMVVEIPAPACAIGSKAASKIATVRETFESLVHPSDKARAGRYQRVHGVRVTVTGVLFFDKVHGQRGVAPNGVELHPLLSIELAK